MPAIRAAKDWGKRPTTVIMRDDWFGHRDPLTGEKVGDKSEWTEWDHVVIDAFQVIEDYTDQYGLLVWEREDERVDVSAIKRIHKFEQARDEITRGSAKKPYVAKPGEYFVPELYSRDKNGEIQTFREWVEKEAKASS